ncbi:Gfo/Idh/MocA family oxidoreductase [Alkalihalobacillus macyae]|uniref:Gfo/Idh/MocA family protein n=1 Tax=Guptibacillus hwajinpoensis TaxID=208199 RepID=UPI00273AA4F1|nr:Gfo/Idh/MocA family oxidoreductase [Alkalihalobacillus macyae]MDP4552384.1 Gfo/Idh/MocA family oxidoreductase [Alkalihalobacillus macyae]
MTKLRMGIIGSGGIAQSRHIPSYQQLAEQVELFGVYDVDYERAKEASVLFNITNVYEQVSDMLKDVDAVTICTPNKFHADLAVQALEAGVHVLCEKPMAMSVEECDRMIEAEKESGKVLSIAYHYRFMKEPRAAHQVIQEGEIGDPMVARVQALRRRKVPGWGVFTNKQLQGGGSLIDYGCHFLDLSMWLMGNPKPVEVSGTTYNRLSKTPEQVNLWGAFDHETFDVDDHVTAYIKFDNNVSMLFETSWSANIAEDKESVSLSGSNGGLEVFPFQLNQAKYGMLLNSSSEWVPGDEDPGLPQAANFVNSCLGLEEPIVSSEEARTVSQVIEAIYESCATGKSVQL